MGRAGCQPVLPIFRDVLAVAVEITEAPTFNAKLNQWIVR
jgi:hypothetical protein